MEQLVRKLAKKYNIEIRISEYDSHIIMFYTGKTTGSLVSAKDWREAKIRLNQLIEYRKL